ncbi:hypothetical protein SERLA73DRAFT_179248 [Serpula lacrymans var. lacrymans S7.3]|uniref:Hyaluronan/mRNA-binding protein domain-containing protein n=2 Tax=Serpula lacrymans var. lacrymans TaxID=341189 RepID=F8PRL6_SERL3|nr:uncharacterized protein SERLADRAFT_464270 [Serpula lacrymans var. lacrymans S7.9]EGO01155.1 hypothetical protein SERLA73DRAFT_179248 [Serpula lacrymans var. lacrymans S7.3]EGO26808.1 hypothetical protein SERLADRAFT_464270 [Serpula lacrymans var. lacrymans S7.9]
MTRTERSVFPRAAVRDRSESKSGLDKSLRKNGGGYHNWGSLADEGYLEAAALEDEQRDLAEVTAGQPKVAESKKPTTDRRGSSFTEAERESARQFRKMALKGEDIDLSAIARTSSAVSTSPPNKTPVVNGAETSSVKSA